MLTHKHTVSAHGLWRSFHILKAVWKLFRSKRSGDITFFPLFYEWDYSFSLKPCRNVLTLLFPHLCELWVPQKESNISCHWAINVSHCYASRLFLIFETAFQHCSNHFLILSNFQFRDFLQFFSSQRNPIENLLKDIESLLDFSSQIVILTPTWIWT